MPDVIIWMICDEKRVAYARIPAHELLYSTTSEEACGRYCGKTRTIVLKVARNVTADINIVMLLKHFICCYSVKFCKDHFNIAFLRSDIIV